MTHKAWCLIYKLAFWWGYASILALGRKQSPNTVLQEFYSIQHHRFDLSLEFIINSGFCILAIYLYLKVVHISKLRRQLSARALPILHPGINYSDCPIQLPFRFDVVLWPGCCILSTCLFVFWQLQRWLSTYTFFTLDFSFSQSLFPHLWLRHSFLATSSLLPDY